LESVEEIISGIKAGEVSQYKRIVEMFQRRMYIYCYQLLDNVQEAEDATQEIFVKAYEKLNSYSNCETFSDDNTGSFSAWLYKIAYNYCISIKRRQKLLQFIPFADMNTEIADDNVGRTMDCELSEKLQSALKVLPAESRSILFFRIFEERSYEDIGKILNLKPAAVRKRYERARKKLAAKLSHRRGELGDGDCAAY
jgi:RNA polymerase sigma-70 factor (ECF subfamily)